MDVGSICFKAKHQDIFDQPDLEEILDILEEVNKGDSFLMLMDLKGFDILLTPAGRDLFNSNAKAIRLIIAEAIVIESRSMRIMHNLLTKIHDPKFPFKAFKNSYEACKWLHKQRD